MAEEVIKQKKQKKEYTVAVGRRKESVARVRLYASVKADLKWGDVAIKKGEILVNGKPIASYFPSQIQHLSYTEPLRVTNSQNKYAFTIRVVGGGMVGQLDATVAAIANVLAKFDSENYRPILKSKGFLTRDSRIRERRKVGMGGKARRKKQSPKR
ncbi:MAG TPA: 30S ribosomal protein S9 [Patescibacteria group bacterium]|nr:30S ribosomal protein S9 [Patescibacteria group bacterium]